MADTQLDNLKGQLTILKSAVEGFAISIGETLMPMVKNIVSKIQSFVDWLNNLDEGTRQVIVKVIVCHRNSADFKLLLLFYRLIMHIYKLLK